jgi:hypothetical protein
MRIGWKIGPFTVLRTRDLAAYIDDTIRIVSTGDQTIAQLEAELAAARAEIERLRAAAASEPQDPRLNT